MLSRVTLRTLSRTDRVSPLDAARRLFILIQRAIRLENPGSNQQHRSDKTPLKAFWMRLLRFVTWEGFDDSII